VQRLCRITVPGLSIESDFTAARERILSDFPNVHEVVATTAPGTRALSRAYTTQSPPPGKARPPSRSNPGMHTSVPGCNWDVGSQGAGAATRRSASTRNTRTAPTIASSVKTIALETHHVQIAWMVKTSR
jgi:hypothetical protein